MNAILFYRCDANHQPIDKELPLEGVDDLFQGIAFPTKGKTFLYGHRNPAVPYLMQNVAVFAAKGNDGSEYRAGLIDLHVEIGKWMRQQVCLEDDPERGLGYTRFLNTSRARKDICDFLTSVWLKNLGSERAGSEDWPKGATRHPYLLDYAMELHEFKHLAVIAYMVETIELGPIKVATVFDYEAIKTVDGGLDLVGADIVLYE